MAVSCKKYTFALANENSDALLAQLVEQLTLNQWVLGSSPRWCTTNSHTIYFVWLFLIVVAIFGGQLLWPLTWLIVSGLFCFSKEILQI